MHPLDYLIHDNKEPKEEMEYIYLLDMIWKPNEFGSFPMTIGRIMTNVKRLYNDSFEFTDKDTGEIYRTNYGSTLAENTPKNVINIDNYLTAKNELELMKKNLKRLSKKIDNLDGPKKI